ncbi:EthD family reductase [Kineococcus sp. SYSU DK003]|uniref:EthD family reductase n=1 Tax=Kineococcus sp. SYSU DK003 TaxID=3383124 RepID=UPI003D7E3B46
MTVKVVALYGQPQSPDDWEKRYLEEHVPMTTDVPGVRARRTARVLSTADGSESPYFYIAELTFDDTGAAQAAIASPAGQALAADYAEHAPAGSLLLIVEETLNDTV